MRHLLFCLLLFNLSQSRSESLTWYEGVIVLHNNQVLVGKLVVDQLRDVVLFHHPDSSFITVLPAFKIKNANFFDVEHNINRRFISVKHCSTERKGHHLYEVVVTGTIWVLRRLSPFHSIQPSTDEFVYYSMENSELIDLKKFGIKVYSRLDSLANRQLSFYVQTQHFNPHLQAHAIRIIQFFNSLEIPVDMLSRK